MIKHESTKNTKPKEMEDEEGAVIGKGEKGRTVLKENIAG